MSNVYLHSKDNIKSIVSKYILALIPLIIYGFYKNGIKLYINGLVTIRGLFKPLVFDFLGLFVGLLVNIIYNKIKNIKSDIFANFYPLYGLLIVSVVSINTNIYLLGMVIFIILLASKFISKFNFNIPALGATVVILLTDVINWFTYSNMYERSNVLTLDIIDYLIGRGTGGVNTTFILFLLFSLFILCREKTYKKEIALYTTVTYSLCIFIYLFIHNDIPLFSSYLFSNGILFSFIFIAPETISSSYSFKGKLIYGIFVGVLTFIIYLRYPVGAVFIAILLISFFNKLIDKVCEKS